VPSADVVVRRVIPLNWEHEGHDTNKHDGHDVAFVVGASAVVRHSCRRNHPPPRPPVDTTSPVQRVMKVGHSRHCCPPQCLYIVGGGNGLVWLAGRLRSVALTRAATRPFALASRLVERDGG
jgi:hypothetical protein